MKVLGFRSLLAILGAGLLVLFTASSAGATPSDEWPIELLDENTVDVDVDIPVTVSGVSAAVLGDATSESAPVIDTYEPPPPPPPPPEDDGGHGILSNNTISVDADAPITVCGVSVAVLGNASGSCSPEVNTGSPAASAGGGGGDGGLPIATPSSDNTVAVDADVPITVCGVSAAVIGDATASCSPEVNTGPPTPTPTTPPAPPNLANPGTPSTPASSMLSSSTSHRAALHGTMSAPLAFDGSHVVAAVGRVGEVARDIAGLPFTGTGTSTLVHFGVALLLAGTALDIWSRRRALAQ